MACKAVLRSVVLKERWMNSFHLIPTNISLSTTFTNFGGCKVRVRVRDFHTRFPLYCSSNNPETPSSSSQDDIDPPQEAVLKAISEVSKTEGRIGQTTNVVIGGTVTDDSTNEWVALDQKVNTYPTFRGFTAIGTGGEDFVHAMVVAVESVLQEPIPEGVVKQKISSGGKYVSVNIGPVHVISSEQVQAVYNAMKRDVRMKYFL
ncbi:hypothetical protein C5167_021978 [Papaver somniferum]|uniref:YbeD-like domain-containing protein n=1 Tax=Papaver somniferum TaxID=3469 RepID=A0A4Y7JGI0_PAPSO|nr:uncharacterized protein LOC113277295 [Papaver somniferum]RZC60224.1 hypothetical protein C5167_021978 [Papaver somniferum]